MSNFIIGSLCSIKNHPFTVNNTDITISALAQMTPPVMVITEILNPDYKFDTDSRDENKMQLRCIFYSHKTGKYESFWFNSNQLKLIFQENTQLDDRVMIENVDFSENDKELLQSGIKHLKGSNIKLIKNLFLQKQVVLKSCDIELGKKKTTFEEENLKAKSKINAHLDFLPPVMTVIDVKCNEEKIKHNSKDGKQKKIMSNFQLKCKWFNPNLNTFSEDFLPIESVMMINMDNSIIEELSRCIIEKKLFEFSYDIPLVLECGNELHRTLIQPIELTFNHHKYHLKYYDFFKSAYDKTDVSKIDIRELMNLNVIISNKLPRYEKDFGFLTTDEFVYKTGHFYRITYKDTQDKISKRVIYVLQYVVDKVIIADCLLRDGAERHFKPSSSNILKIEELYQSLFDLKKGLSQNSNRQISQE